MHRWLLTAVLLGTGACRTPQADVPASRAEAVVACELPAAPEEVISGLADPYPGELHEVFDLPDAPEWWAPALMDDERQRYRAALVAKLGGEARLAHRTLLEEVRNTHAAMVGKPMAREAENTLAILEGRAGTVDTASCLEWRLFQRQARRFPMIERPTEFGAYVLRGKGRIRVYLSGADRIGGRLRHEVRDRVMADVAQGFAPVAHLHNHPFMFDRVPGDRMWTTPETVNDVGGGIAPSLTDVQAYRQMRESFGLQGAWVTNGLETGRYTATDFDRLSAWE
ncbi:hypothetical protein HPC49_01440 [Pyxidicoccus fallax]|uniref:Lipoprotein n=1 Tax=Pyxidicoccus fallax TaxID=394095 RepID=A0A848LGN7_9BACT|nr:hypothetical protein [Pyxidicoccus fallax]NMO15218.1 hypothetical protein [Pyxidicoccus fallax]NPC76917.1 hypothetical protein [Pyxidicoccus fallax]